ncbi:MAG: hypothetical protein CMM50_18005 [Rhodospirillaceae bacterium]|nr:hypothetical protein [Rhodospirillaceae bacterium]|tara:strand:- start:170 stop:409 length:240 start_codon:yes stop_codon:yes gene_type:complete
MPDPLSAPPSATIGAVSVHGRPQDAALGRSIAEAVAGALGEHAWTGDRALKTLRIRVPENAGQEAIRAALSRSLGGGDG